MLAGEGKGEVAFGTEDEVGDQPALVLSAPRPFCLGEAGEDAPVEVGVAGDRKADTSDLRANPNRREDGET